MRTCPVVDVIIPAQGLNKHIQVRESAMKKEQRWAIGIVAVVGAVGLIGMQVDGQERRDVSPRQQADQDSDLYRATEVIGMTIRDDGGEPVGKVTDIVIDGRTEQVQYLIIEDVEVVEDDQLLILPWQFARVNYADDPNQSFVVLGIGRDRLRGAPAFGRGNFNLRRNADWRVQVNTFFDIDDRGSRRRVSRPDLDDGNRRDRRDDRRRDGDTRRSRRDAPEGREGDRPRTNRDADAPRNRREGQPEAGTSRRESKPDQPNRDRGAEQPESRAGGEKQDKPTQPQAKDEPGKPSPQPEQPPKEKP